MAQLPFRNISILGVGLIGGSLASAWRRHDPGLSITGFDRAEVLEQALKTGIVHRAAKSLDAAVAGADLIVLATPLSAVLSLLSDLADLVSPGQVLTDVGSVKGPIARHAHEVLPDHVLYVPGHPMTGSEQSGVTNANPFLFENATYVLCPPAAQVASGLENRYTDLVACIRATGARLLPMTPERHDRIAAFVSHLPQLLAVLLTGLVGDENERDEAVIKLAAGGFRDMTRVAGSSFDVWGDIVALNEPFILDALAGIASAVQSVRNRIIESDQTALREAFENARSVRESIPRDSRGFLAPLADVYVNADDRPGWIAEVAAALYQADLNIKDMELLQVREGTGGTFRLSFAEPSEASDAVLALEMAGFEAYRLSS